MALSSLLKEGGKTELAVQNYKTSKQAQKEAGVVSNRAFLERKKTEAEGKKNFFNPNKYENWLVPSNSYEKAQAEAKLQAEEAAYVENAKVRFKGEHRVNIEGQVGTTVVVPAGWECGGCYSKRNVKVQSASGILTFRKGDVEVLEMYE